MIEETNEILPQDSADKEASGGRRPSACCASSDEDVVLDAGMEIEDGLAWLQAGNILNDGSDAPEWMWAISGFDVESAAEIIRHNDTAMATNPAPKTPE